MPLVYSYESTRSSAPSAPSSRYAQFLAAGGEEFLLVNGDSLCDWPLAELLAKHRKAAPKPPCSP